MAVDDDDTEYLEGRAEAELILAQGATNPKAVKAHYVLAGLYLDRIYGPEAPAPTEPESSSASTSPSPANGRREGDADQAPRRLDKSASGRK